MEKITIIDDFLKVCSNKKIKSKIEFRGEDFSNIIKCKNITFKKNVVFNEVTFEKDVDFSEVTFEDEVKFENCIFQGYANFSEVSFNADTYFGSTIFQNGVSFENSECKDGSIDFEGLQFKHINFEKVMFTYPIFIDMHSFGISKSFCKKNFSSKESVRVIRASLDEKKNHTEASKYFPIEQKLYIDALKKNNVLDNFFKLIPLYVDQWISCFGTSWIRVMVWQVLFLLVVATLLYCLCNGHTWSVDGALSLMVPVKLFGVENKSIIGIPIWSASLVKMVSIYLVWQFVKSFRLDTKRF